METNSNRGKLLLYYRPSNEARARAREERSDVMSEPRYYKGPTSNLMFEHPKQEHLELPGKQNFPLVALTKTDEKVLKALT